MSYNTQQDILILEDNNVKSDPLCLLISFGTQKIFRVLYEGPAQRPWRMVSALTAHCRFYEGGGSDLVLLLIFHRILTHHLAGPVM